MSSGAALQVQDVSVRYEQFEALRSISLSIPAGSRIALVGPSGAGKTTLLKLLGAGILPSEGMLRFDEQLVSSLSLREIRELRTRVGFISQHFDVIPNLRVYQNVLLGRIGRFGLLGLLREFGFPRRGVLEDIYRVLQRLGIQEKMYIRTDRLSGGQRQRVAIARALFQQPSLLLADEPISSVDPTRAQATVELLDSLARETNATLVVSLHNFELASQYFTRLIGLQRGEILFDAAPADISAEMRTQLYELEGSELLQ